MHNNGMDTNSLVMLFYRPVTTELDSDNKMLLLNGVDNYLI